MVSSTKDSYVRLGGSSLADRVARLEDFSRRVAALAAVASRVSADHLLAPRYREDVLSRCESSLLRASAALSRGSYPVGARGLWSLGALPGGAVRKDSTPTSRII